MTTVRIRAALINISLTIDACVAFYADTCIIWMFKRAFGAVLARIRSARIVICKYLKVYHHFLSVAI